MTLTLSVPNITTTTVSKLLYSILNIEHPDKQTGNYCLCKFNILLTQNAFHHFYTNFGEKCRMQTHYLRRRTTARSRLSRCTPSLLSKDHKNVISMRKLLHYYSIYSKETANLPRSETNISLTGPFVSSLILQCSVV